MSRVGKVPVTIPSGVTVTVDGTRVAAKGPKGTNQIEIHPVMALEQTDTQLLVKRPSDSKHHRALHGLTRALLSNLVTGVSQGFTKTLELHGVGFRAQMEGTVLVLQVGYSHPVRVPSPEGLGIEVPEPGKIVVSGIDKCLVGQAAAEIRAARPPEPYKGKGIRYEGEYVRRKAGKAGIT